MRGALHAAVLPALLLLLALPTPTRGHGQITWPPSTRHGGNVHAGADCARGECFWFSNNVEIPPVSALPGTLPASMRSMEPEVEGGKHDVWRTHPWRAPGTAPVYGNGCGIAGGHPTLEYANGGIPPENTPLGFDGAILPSTPRSGAARWLRGGVAEIAWAMSANHAGGYAYRLCKKDTPGGITESCFQKGHLRFSNASSATYALYPDARGRARLGKRRTTVSGTTPPGSEWARVIVPTCRECDSAYDRCGSPLRPVPGLDYGTPWNRQVNCYAACAGSVSSGVSGSCPDRTQFRGTDRDEEGPNFSSRSNVSSDESNEHAKYSGYGKSIWEWSLLDTVEVPSDVPLGSYVLSWRWDCEQSAQVWQNCADVDVTDDARDTMWDVASGTAIQSVPKVARGIGKSPGEAANELCVEKLEFCGAAEGKASDECGEDSVKKTCRGASSGGSKGDVEGIFLVNRLVTTILLTLWCVRTDHRYE